MNLNTKVLISKLELLFDNNHIYIAVLKCYNYIYKKVLVAN